MDDASQDPSADPDLICSGRGCQAAARHQVLWNNPRLHTPERRKVWLACDEHRDSLAGFLSARGFLRGVEPLARSDGEGVPDDIQVSER